MKWNELWEGISHVVLSEATPMSVEHVCCSSAKARDGSVFVCIKGTRQDGAAYLKEVWQRGCRCIVADRRLCLEQLRGVCEEAFEKACVVLVADCREAYALLCRNLFGRPDRALCMIGITGTKGKTTTASFLYQMLLEDGVQAGQIGTCGAVWQGHEETLACTTPDAGVLYSVLARMRDDGVTHVVMEVSSQALKQKRVRGITYEVGVFTNLYPDHISENEHADMEEYFYWKRQLFSQCRAAVLPDKTEVPEVQKLYGELKGKIPVYFVKPYFRPDEPEDACCLCTLAAPVEYIRYYHKPAQRLTVRMCDGRCFRQLLAVPGSFQVANYLFAAAVLSVLGMPVREHFRLKTVPGRMECVAVCGGACFYVDYAHNAEALEEALLSLRAFEPKHLICVFGCGGNRSRLRRGPMGRVSTSLADITIVTEDNSRNEAFSDICADILDGVEAQHRTLEVVENRALAIRHAVELSEAGDIVIIAGKGHEQYMEKSGKRTSFSDTEEVKKYVRICRRHH